MEMKMDILHRRSIFQIKYGINYSVGENFTLLKNDMARVSAWIVGVYGDGWF